MLVPAGRPSTSSDSSVSSSSSSSSSSTMSSWYLSDVDSVSVEASSSRCSAAAARARAASRSEARIGVEEAGGDDGSLMRLSGACGCCLGVWVSGRRQELIEIGVPGSKRRRWSVTGPASMDAVYQGQIVNRDRRVR